MLELTSARLHIREVTADDLSPLLPVYTSNPEYVQQNEGSEGEIGRYDLERWQRDWQIAQMMPGNHWLGCYLKTDDTPIGTVQFMEADDYGQPWLGSLTIHKDYQRQGLGSETFQCLADQFRREFGWTTLHVGVKAPNEAGLAFVKRLGFQAIGGGSSRFAGGIQEFFVLEYLF